MSRMSRGKFEGSNRPNRPKRPKRSYRSNRSNRSNRPKRLANGAANGAANWAANGAAVYPMTRFYPAELVDHEEARYIPQDVREEVRAGRRAVVPDPNGVPAAMARVRPNSRRAYVRFWADLPPGTDLAAIRTDKRVQRPWLGKRVGGGEYGQAYLTRADVRYLGPLRASMRHAVHVSTPSQGEEIVVKIADRLVDEPIDEFVRANVREAAVHQALASSPCVRMPGMASLCPRDFVPKLHFAGAVQTPELASGWAFVTVMSRAAGSAVRTFASPSVRTPRTPRTLNKDMRGRSPPGKRLGAYLGLERAACALWASGYVHADMHLGNAMYDAATQRVTLIDFGHAARLPDDMLPAIRKAIAEGVRLGVRSLGEAWLEPGIGPGRSGIGTGLQRHVNKVVFQRNHEPRSVQRPMPWYNPDGNALMRMYSALALADRKKVAVKRAELWGAK